MAAGDSKAEGRPEPTGPHLLKAAKERIRSASVSGRALAPDAQPGDQIGHYHLIERLGKGGAGEVFAARAPTGETVAVKILATQKVRRARIVDRFFDEVRAATTVEHESLIKVHDFIEEPSPLRLAYVMEYVPGETVRERLIRQGSLNLRTAIQIGARICDALEALHAGGIVHRDLKPENVLLVKGTGDTEGGAPPAIKLLDFGVVKFLEMPDAAEVSDEPAGVFVGTPRYMAPEQAAGVDVDGRADLFSLGVMLFEMITGRCPHDGDSLKDVVIAKLAGAPRITVNPEKELLPEELTEIVDACLRLQPADRPNTARVLGAVLKSVEDVLFAVGPVRVDDRARVLRDTVETGDLPEEASPERLEDEAPSAENEAEALDPEDAAPTKETPQTIETVRPKRRTLMLALASAALAVALIVLIGVLYMTSRPEPVVLVPANPSRPPIEAPVP